MTAIAGFRIAAGSQKEKAEGRAVASTARRRWQDKSARARHRQAIGMARGFVRGAVGRAYGIGNSAAISKVTRMQAVSGAWRRQP